MDRPGPWIDHDGKGFPREIIARERRRGGYRVELHFDVLKGQRFETPAEQASVGLDVNNPAWTWGPFRSWVPPFRKVIRSVDPAYGRVVRYRFIYRDRDGDSRTSEQVEKLKDLVADPKPVDAPSAPEVAE